MFYNAKNGNIKIRNSNMDYISFGKGDKNLILIPGLGDGLKTVKGTALPIAIMYKCFTKKYKVFVLSRINDLEESYSTRDMAKDYKAALETLGISQTDVIGISQGGMIAQYLAIDNPELINKLVLVVTLSRQNETVKNVINNWLKFAEMNDYKNIFIDTTEKSYTESRLRKYRPFYPLLSKISKPKNLKRFIIQAKSCISHNSYDELEKIKCNTLVIGVDDDKIVGKETSEELSEKIKDSKLVKYNGFGHGVYEEVKDFNEQILEYLSL